jgi:hypothetical protein
MRFFLSEPLKAASKISRMRSEDYLLTIVCVLRLKLVIDGRCQALGPKLQPGPQKTANFDDGVGNSPRYGGDFAPYKPRTDVTLMGHGYCPGGHKLNKLRVTLGVDEWRKSLDLVGSQDLVRNRTIELTLSEPFTSMALRMENAFGGLDSPFNPWGKGYGHLDTKPGSKIAACNIHPAGMDHVKWDEKIPASAFGPLPANRPPRLPLRGTYDKAWLYRRNPLPPLDFDWSFYNVAPADQQFTPFLLGNETLYFEHLHPVKQTFTTALPGLRHRMLLRRELPGQAEPQIEEAHPVLDSVHVDMDAMTIDLAWRAVARTPDKEGRDVTHCYVATESMDDKAPPWSEHVAAFAAEVNPPVIRPTPPPSPPGPTEEEKSEDETEALETLRAAVMELPFDAEFKDAVQQAKTSAKIKSLIEAEAKKAQEYLAKLKKT